MSDQNTVPVTAVVEKIKSVPLSAIFIVHFIFTTWAVLGFWSPQSYFFYNILFFITIFWSMHSKDNEEPILLSLVINGISILFDVIVLCIYSNNIGGSSEKFSQVMAVFNLLLRPVSCIALYKQWRDRINGPPTDFNFGGSTSASKATQQDSAEGQSYQDGYTGESLPGFYQ